MKNIAFTQSVEGINYVLEALINVFLIMFIMISVLVSVALIAQISKTEKNEVETVKEDGKKPLLKRIFNM
jgi:hypothetical protein